MLWGGPRSNGYNHNVVAPFDRPWCQIFKDVSAIIPQFFSHVASLVGQFFKDVSTVVQAQVLCQLRQHSLQSVGEL